jgi:hypothetical protein
VLYKGYPQPWRTWLLILSAVIVVLFVVQIVASTGWALFVVILVLIAIQLALARYARRQS